MQFARAPVFAEQQAVKYLDVDGTTKTCTDYTPMDAGIGGNTDSKAGSITINGGTIIARGGTRAAGIGGGYSDDSDSGYRSITINGGDVTAYGEDYSAGYGEDEHNELTLYPGANTARSQKPASSHMSSANGV